uniref:Putative ovule protein n=1 Tax=Solanum chacoense TaxID=4108 RepID=A0A0V0I868_SOLCH
MKRKRHFVPLPFPALMSRRNGQRIFTLHLSVMGELFLETKSVPTSTFIGAMRFSIVVLEQVPAIFGLIERNGWKYLILVKSESSFSSEDDFCKVPWPLVYVIVPDVQDGIFVSQFMSVIF